MLLRIGYEMSVTCAAPVPMLLALSLHSSFSGKVFGQDRVNATSGAPVSEYLDAYGNRISRVVAPPGQTTFWTDCVVEVPRQADQAPVNARQQRIEDLPHEVLTFLTASRYSDSDKLSQFAWNQFGMTQEGWPRVQAISDFVHEHIDFGYQFGRPDKSANDALIEGRGVCRDYAHLAIAFCRAMNIPARYASGYLGDIDVPDMGPDDFSAWFEVWLDGAWHTWDARFNVPRIGRVLMVRGTDASDVAMITSFGPHVLDAFRVWVTELPADTTQADIDGILTTLPGPKYPGGFVPQPQMAGQTIGPATGSTNGMSSLSVRQFG